MKTVKNLKGKDFINLEDFSSDELKGLIKLAIELKKKNQKRQEFRFIKK